jgi:hypothetical protein
MNAGPSLQGSRWTQRSDDESFSTIEALRAHVGARRQRATVRTVPLHALRPVPTAHGVDLELEGVALRPSPWAARQYSVLVGLPARAVQVLSPRLAAAALTERVDAVARGRRSPVVEIVEEQKPEGPATLRSLVGPRYARAWDVDLVDALLGPLAARGWAPAESRTPSGGSRTGLFASDRDLFCFLTHDDAALELPGAPGRPLRRGLLIRNSEVGGVALRVQSFWFNAWCTNRMIFGAQEVVDLRELHVAGRGGPLERLLEHWEAWGGFDRLEAPPLVAADIAQSAAAHPLAARCSEPGELVEELVERTSGLAVRARAGSILRRPLLRAGAQLALEHYLVPDQAHVSLWAMAGGLT